MPSAALLDKGLPLLGGIVKFVELVDEPLVVVGTFCIFAQNESRFFTAVTQKDIDQYLDWVSQQTLSGATKYREAFLDLSTALLTKDRRARGQWKAFSFPQKILQDTTKSGKYDIRLSQEHQEALTNHCAHHQFFDVDGKMYVVDGHYLTGTINDPKVMVTLFACRGGDLYKTVPLERLLSQPVRLLRHQLVRGAPDSALKLIK